MNLRQQGSERQADQGSAAPVNQDFTVSDLTMLIKNSIESLFPAGISVRGEISNLRDQSSGHLYFTLKDSLSQIGVVVFKGYAQALARPPKNGDQVLISGSLALYAPQGRYQLVAKSLRWIGMGELLLRFYQLKEQLDKKGWFAPERKKPLPTFPKTIGIITSPTGAVIQDMIRILHRRCPTVAILLNPVRVQGVGASQEIAQAIKQFSLHATSVDLLIVGRGGGSFEDLAAFNTLEVAQAIFECPIPLVSAVGHETDSTIADWVADLRAPTPSAAAELAVADQEQLKKELQKYGGQAQAQIAHRIALAKKEINRFANHTALQDPYRLLGVFIQRLDEDCVSLDEKMKILQDRFFVRLQSLERMVALLHPKNSLKNVSNRLFTSRQGIDLAWSRDLARRKKEYEQLRGRFLVMLKENKFLKQKRASFERVVAHLNSLDPKNVLKKGYAVLFSQKTHAVIRSADDFSIGDQVRILLGQGEALAMIQDKKTEPIGSTP